MHKLAALVIGVGLLIVGTASGFADSGTEYWPAWRGPTSTGVSETGDPPVTWSETENVKWKVEFPGDGTSSPIVWGDKVFFQTAIETGEKGPVQAPVEEPKPAEGRRGRRSFHGGKTPTNVYEFDVVCLSRGTGEILWQQTARRVQPHEGHHPTHGFASYSPVTDGERVWASFGSRGVHCYDMDGTHQWSVDLGKMISRVTFGEGSSPALAGDALIVVMDHEGDSRILALDKATGETIWETGRDEHTNWSTPLVVSVSGRVQVVTSATYRARSYDLETGDLLWECGGQTLNAIPTPVAGFGMVFCTSGFRGSALQAIKLDASGDVTGTGAVAWEINEATPYVPSPLLYGDAIYFCSGNRGIVSCYGVRAGEARFVEQRLEGLKDVYASPVGAAGRVYFVDRKGICQVIERSEQFQVLATNSLDDAFDASPAIVDKELFLKGKSHLYCIATP